MMISFPCQANHEDVVETCETTPDSVPSVAADAPQEEKTTPKQTPPPPSKEDEDAAEHTRVREVVQTDVDVQIADQLLIYDSFPLNYQEVPDTIKSDSGGRLFIIPPPRNSRGHPNKSVKVAISSRQYPMLDAFTSADAIAVGLAHDPALASTVKASG